MHHALTDEQIEKATDEFMALWSKQCCETWRAGIRNVLGKVAGYLQYAPAPPQLSGDVIEAMCKAFGSVSKVWPVNHFEEAMTAAAQVLLERVLSPVSDEEWGMRATHLNNAEQYVWRKAFDYILAKRRNSLLKPAEPTQREKLIEILQLWSPSLVNTPISEIADDIETLFLHTGASQ